MLVCRCSVESSKVGSVDSPPRRSPRCRMTGSGDVDWWTICGAPERREWGDAESSGGERAHGSHVREGPWNLLRIGTCTWDGGIDSGAPNGWRRINYGLRLSGDGREPRLGGCLFGGPTSVAFRSGCRTGLDAAGTTPEIQDQGKGEVIAALAEGSRVPFQTSFIMTSLVWAGTRGKFFILCSSKQHLPQPCFLPP